MQALSRTLAFLLLAALAAAPVAALDVYPHAAAHQRPAGCHLSTDHEGSGSVPAHGPASHGCCQGAHHPAILPQSSTAQPSFRGSASVDHTLLAAIAVLINFPNSVIASGGPPLLSPLRV
jgi:hypothetical protein